MDQDLECVSSDLQVQKSCETNVTILSGDGAVDREGRLTTLVEVKGSFLGSRTSLTPNGCRTPRLLPGGIDKGCLVV